MNLLSPLQKYSSNSDEVSMLEGYIWSFTYGSVEDHKEGSRHWIRNRGPVVETYVCDLPLIRITLGDPEVGKVC